jgi:hypothetical protein
MMYARRSDIASIRHLALMVLAALALGLAAAGAADAASVRI